MSKYGEVLFILFLVILTMVIMNFYLDHRIDKQQKQIEEMQSQIEILQKHQSLVSENTANIIKIIELMNLDEGTKK